MLRRLTAALLAAFVPGGMAAAAATGSSEDAWRSLMTVANLPALSVAVIRDRTVVERAHLGFAKAPDLAVTTDTLFEAASRPKPVFATVVLRLAEQGVLDLDRPLAELLSYERIDHDPRSRAMTARLVLSHQTGLPNWGPETLELGFSPGDRFGYSGEGYVYLQKVVETLTGQNLDTLARREVFTPLGMTHSRFSWPEGEHPSLASAHDAAGRPQDKYEPHEANAAASLHTTAEDYARFVIGWMDGSLLSAETRSAALSPAVRVLSAGDPKQVAGGERLAWGLGWGLLTPDESDGEPLVFHWGDNGPAKAFVAFRPRTGLGIVYFANSDNGLAIAPSMVAPILGAMDPVVSWLGYERSDAPGFEARLAGLVAAGDGRYQDAIDRYQEALAAAPGDEVTARRVLWLGDLLRLREHPIPVPPQTLQSYAGVYGPRRLEMREGSLWYQRGDRSPYRLLPLSDTLFALEGMADFRIEVRTDDAGAPVGLIGHYVEGETDESPRDPEPPVE